MTTVTGSWSTVQLAGHACDLYEPTRRNAYGFTIVYLHSADCDPRGELQPFLALLDGHGLPVIAPHTRRSWWTDKICEEFDGRLTAERYLLDHVLHYVQSPRSEQPGYRGLFGMGMGGQGALRLAYKHPNAFPVVAALTPAVDYQLLYDDDPNIQQMYPDPEAVRQDTATLHIHPLNWPRHQFFACDPSDPWWWEGADRLRMKLASLGVPHECELEVTGDGTELTYHRILAERTVDFLAERLDRERRRLV